MKRFLFPSLFKMVALNLKQVVLLYVRNLPYYAALERIYSNGFHQNRNNRHIK